MLKLGVAIQNIKIVGDGRTQQLGIRPLSFLESRGMHATTKLFILSRAGCLPRQEWREVGQAIIRAQAKQQQGLCSG